MLLIGKSVSQTGEGASSNLVVLTNGFRLKLLGKYGRLGFEPQHLHKSNFIIWGGLGFDAVLVWKA